MKLLAPFLTAVASLVFATAAHADYPDRPITMVVPFSPGGPTDVVARTLAASMQSTLKQTIVIDNAAGAGGTIGSNKVAKSSPDGYSILLMHIGMATAPSLYKSLPFDPLKDFEYIGLVVDVPMTMLGRKDLAAANTSELLALIKKSQGKTTLANAGVGSASHLCGLLFMSAIGQEMTTVPYRGAAPAMNDLLGGQVDMLCDQTTTTTSQISSGGVKAYGITSLKRIPTLANLPTLDEGGIKGFQVGAWHGVYVAKGTPKPVVDKLVASLDTAIKDPAFVKRMGELGAVIYSEQEAKPAALKTKLESEIAKWTPIIRKAGVYAE
ncbi:tripartite tricarboxylate transporter substrate binding protein BugD [soil metagenome]